MTERKPHGMSHETWVDKQIREAQERGDFDDLPGTGAPIPGAGQPYDDKWWINGLLHREGMSVDAALPESLQLRREYERLPGALVKLGSEHQVRAAIAELNARIEKYLRMPTEPFARVSPLDVEIAVTRWRATRNSGRAAAVPPVQPKRSWWQRRR